MGYPTLVPRLVLTGACTLLLAATSSAGAQSAPDAGRSAVDNASRSSVHALAVRLVSLTQPTPPDPGALYNQPPASNASPQEARIRAGYQQMMRDQLRAALPPDSLRAITVRAYEQTYTANEMRELLAFYSGALGQRYLQGQAAVSAKISADIQSAVRAREPAIRQQAQALLRAELDSLGIRTP